MNIYVASSWRNPDQPDIVERLRSWGHEVYDFRNPTSLDHGFTWSQIDPDWRNWNVERFRSALQHGIAVGGFELDHTAMRRADACVLVLPCGRSAHLEAGWFCGQDKRVFAVLGRAIEPELMYAMFDAIVETVEELRTLLAAAPEAGFMTADEESMLNDLLEVESGLRGMDMGFLEWLDGRRDMPLSSTQHDWLNELTDRHL